MAKFEIKFFDCYDDTNIAVECIKNEYKDANCNKLISITIASDLSDESLCIHLDKSTAIKFAKTLRTEINKITESEVKNA